METSELTSNERSSSAQRTAKTARSDQAIIRWIAIASAVIPILVLIGNGIGPERWWLGSFNLYIPQAVWGVPAIIAFLLALRSARKLVWLPLVALVVVLGPLMGFCVPVPSPHSGPGDRRLKVMTWNVKGRRNDHEAVIAQIRRERPDVAVFQEWAPWLKKEIARVLPDYQFEWAGQFAIASRLRIVNFTARIAAGDKSKRAIYARGEMETIAGPVTIYVLHLASPRQGLAMLRHPRKDPDEAADAIEENAALRLAQARRIAGEFANESGPVIVAGDLNAPLQSMVCREFTSRGLRDAFAEAGFGYGYTYGHHTPLGTSFLRIDHILVNSPWRPLTCYTGDSADSDHRPVISDIAISASGQTQ